MTAASPDPLPGRKWFQDAWARLGAFASGDEEDARPSTDGDAPQPEPLALLLVDLASLYADGRPVASAPDDGRGAFESPEAFAALAARYDIEIQFESRAAASLQSADLPAAFLTTSGAGRMLMSREGRIFTARGAGRTYRIALEALAAEEAGTVFLMRSRALDSKMAQTPDDAAPQADDPLRGVIDHMLTKQRRLLVQLLVAAAFSNLMLLALPVYTGLVFDRVIPHSAFDTLWAVSIGVLLALLADLAVRWVRMKLQDALAGAASAALQASLMRRLVHVRMAEAPRSASSVTMRLREIDGLTQLAPQILTGVVIDAPFLTLVLALIWMNGGAVVLAPLCGVALLAAVHHVANLGAEKDQARAMRLAQLQNRQLIETVEGLETVKITRTERRVLGRFERLYDEYAWSSHVTRLWQGFAAYANATIGQVMIVMVMLIGVYQISAASMTVGGLSACALLVGRVIMPIGQLVTAIHRVYQSRATLKVLSDGAGGRAEAGGDTSGALAAPPAGALRLSGVSFSYPGQTAPQVANVTLSIQPGERVAIIGRSGSGKSTLLKLLVRLMEPQQGAILVDEFDARQYAPTVLRRSLGYMGQTPGLIDDTLLANMTLGLDAVDSHALDAMARLTGVAEFAARHPQGYGMNIGPRGERLSGGERQSAALARLLLANPKVLILDEPTAAMDTMLETRLVRDLKNHIGARTLIVATHRAPILELVDRLIWLDNGRVIADGLKADVLKRLGGAA